MQNLSLQDILAIVGLTSGPILALMGIMWRHSNEQFKELKKEMKEIKEEMKEMKGEIQEVKIEMKEMEIRSTNQMKEMDMRSTNEIKEVKIEMKEMEIGMRGMESRLTNKIEDTYKSLTKQIITDRERISHIEGQLEPASIIRLPIKETPKKSLRTQRQAVSA